MKKVILLFLLLIIFVVACTKVEKPITKVECNTNNECGTGGCSSQICGKKGEVENIITTCEFKAEYECLKETSCSCINNKCQWQQNNVYLSCLDKIKKNPVSSPQAL